jgi:hypothetical protein
MLIFDYLFFKDFHTFFLFNELIDLMGTRMGNQTKVRRHAKDNMKNQRSNNSN